MSYAQVVERSNHIGDFPEILTGYVGHFGCCEEVMHSLQLFVQNLDPTVPMFDKLFLFQVDDSGAQYDHNAFSPHSQPSHVSQTIYTAR